MDEICCMGVNLRYGKVPVSPFYVKFKPKMDLDAVRACWLSWLSEQFYDKVPFWYVFTHREAMMVSVVLGKDWFRYWDGSKSVVVEQVISFLNNYSVWNEDPLKIDDFWKFTNAIRIKHEFKTLGCPQQDYVLPDMIRFLSNNVKLVKELVY